MNKYLACCVAAMALLITGCPRNEYTVELTPRDNGLERRLTCDRADPDHTNSAQPYETVPEDELAAITRLYPPAGATHYGKQYFFKGEFSGAMPADVGGAGFYTNLTTSLGSAGFYSERFRGNDDLAGVMEQRARVADQVADILAGWTRMELGREPHYEKLRQFVDVNFRHDLKSLDLYLWLAQVSPVHGTNMEEELGVRVGQYLLERGYVKLQDLPDVHSAFVGSDEPQFWRLLRAFVAGKLELPESGPSPKSLAFLQTQEAARKSLDAYLATTDAYGAKLDQWKKEKRLNAVAPKPDPETILSDLGQELLELNFPEAVDHLNVKLSLPVPPVHTNGKWDGDQKKVLWESDLGERTNRTRFPVLCYAEWSRPDEVFQKEHFGAVTLNGDALAQYSLWRAALTARQADEWDALLATLQPGDGQKIDAFRFADEPSNPGFKSEPPPVSPSAFARQLLKSVLAAKPGKSN